MRYEISTCQMQYDATNKETDQKDPCFIYMHVLWWERSSKMSKASSILGSLSQMICDGILMSAIFALRQIGLLASWDEIFTACPQEVKEAAYKGLVHPVLEYSGSVAVQNRAPRCITGNYNFETGSMTGILDHLKWESLKKRRRDSRLMNIVI